MLNKIYNELVKYKSFDKLSFSDLSKKLGISRQGLYYYFSSPEDMFLHYFNLERKKFFDSSTFKEGSMMNISASIYYFRESSYLNKLISSDKYCHIAIKAMEKFIYQYFFSPKDDVESIMSVEKEYHCKAIIGMFIEYVKDPKKNPALLELYEKEMLNYTRQKFGLGQIHH